MKNIPFFLLLIFCIGVIPVSGSINITFQSQNPYDVSIISLNQTVINSTSNGNLVNVPFDNYDVRVISNSTNSLSWVNLWGFLSGVTARIVAFIIIIFLAYMVIAYVGAFK